jgi:hypothetical protein
LNRWGIGHKRLGGIWLHRITAPDPGVDLHDHPFTFWSLILRGGYNEERVPTWDAIRFAQRAAKLPKIHLRRGFLKFRHPWTLQKMGMDECHRITHIYAPVTWTLVLRGPTRKGWGFFTPTGYVDHRLYKGRDLVES